MAKSEYNHGVAILQLFVTFLFSPHAVLEKFGSAEPTCAQLWGWMEVPCAQGLMPAVPRAPLTRAFPPQGDAGFPPQLAPAGAAGLCAGRAARLLHQLLLALGSRPEKQR